MNVTTMNSLALLAIVLAGCRANDERWKDADPERPWPVERAWAWYEEVGAIRGCNYLPRSATNTTEMWQAETFTPDVIDEELGWAEDAGYDAVRVFVQFLVWKHDREGLLARLDEFLRIADGHGIRTMLVPFDDCAFGYPARTDPYLGPQGDPEPGEYSPYWTPSPGHSRVDDPEAWPELEAYVKDLVGTFRDDARVFVWDLYNEPTMSGAGERSLPLVEAAFAWAREMRPSQPLTVGAFADFRSESSRRWLELSDVVTFHGYDPVGGLAEKIRICNEYGRPVLCTECMIRRNGNTLAGFLPLFAEQHVGWFQWGLVAGRTHTFYHWGSKKGTPVPETWQHDVFHPDGTPYDPAEIELIRNWEFTDLAPVEIAPVDEGRSWRYVTDIPLYGWHLEEYDDSSWYEGLAPFGTRETPWVDVKTLWSARNIWLRRSFELEKVDFVNPHLRIRHDEHAEVYLNGVLAAKVEGYNTTYDLVPVGERAWARLRPGTNVMSAHCHQTWGGQCFDVQLVDVRSPEGLNREPRPSPTVPTEPGEPWSVERAREWYRGLDPIRGCNYLPRTAVNSVEMWRAETFDPATIDEELGWARDAGYNSLRVFLQYVVWKNDPDGFCERFERFLEIADAHGITVMPIFFDDVCFAMKLEPIDAPQDDPVLGIINSGWVPSPGYSMVQDPSTWPELRAFVHDVVRRHREDRRVVVWDLYNEPGPFFDSTLSFPLARAAFGWVRELDPVQPLTIGLWGNPSSREFLELSDVISIHNYGGGLEPFFVEQEKESGRPVLVTEFLMRPGPGGFADQLPVFAEHRVGWYNWGLVAGRTQTYYSWGSPKGAPMPEVWMCDVLRPDGTPYDPAEIEMIRRFTFPVE